MSRLDEKDEFGARMKAYEHVETKRVLDIHKPIYARIDGRSFSKFTRGMERPYDTRMSIAMIETTKHLVKQTNACIGYTQSDEISLVILAKNENSDIFFAGKVQKMVSVLASMATAKFMSVCPTGFEYRLPHFDSRVFNLPSKTEAANAILWRAMDARKNAIFMVAHTLYSHKELHEKSQHDMLMMIEDKNINFDCLPAFFTRGTFIRSVNEMRLLTEDEKRDIPLDKIPIGPVKRSKVVACSFPPFNEVRNREAVIFDQAEPILPTIILN